MKYLLLCWYMMQIHSVCDQWRKTLLKMATVDVSNLSKYIICLTQKLVTINAWFNRSPVESEKAGGAYAAIVINLLDVRARVSAHMK